MILALNFESKANSVAKVSKDFNELRAGKKTAIWY